MNTRACKAVAVALMLSFAPACGGIQNVLPDIQTVIADVRNGIPEAELLLSLIGDAGNLILMGNTSPAAVKFRSAMDAAKLALVSLARFTNGADDATQLQLDAAKDEFVAAWKALIGAAKDLGIISGGKLSVKRGGTIERLQIVTPRLATPK